MTFALGIEPTPRIELPLWGNVLLLLLVAAVIGFIIKDLIEVYRINKEDK